MHYSQLLVLAIAASTTASPIGSDSAISGGITGILEDILPSLLGNIEQFAPTEFEDVLGDFGLATLPGRKAVMQKRSISEEMDQVADVVSTLCRGAIDFAEYANLDVVAEMLRKVQPALASN